jgi:hypothetical protein
MTRPAPTAISMRSTLWALSALALLGGCPSSDGNAPTVWLYLNGRETDVILVDFEPPPY